MADIICSKCGKVFDGDAIHEENITLKPDKFHGCANRENQRSTECDNCGTLIYRTCEKREIVNGKEIVKHERKPADAIQQAELSPEPVE